MLNNCFDNTVYSEFIGQDKTRAAHYAALLRELETLVKDSHFNTESPIKILDMGCGDGRFAKFLKARFGDKVAITGFDPAHKLIEIAKQSASDINFIEASAQSFQSNETYDIVFSTLVLPYAENTQSLNDMFAAAHGHIAKGGHFISVTFNPGFIPTGQQDAPNRSFERLANHRIRINFLSHDDPNKIEVRADARHWGKKPYEMAARNAGFRSINWKLLDVTANGSDTAETHGIVTSRCPYIVLDMQKPREISKGLLGAHTARTARDGSDIELG